MAVARVFGRVDGVEVILEHLEGDIWQVPVPPDWDGEYVIEILAEDEAGNQAYLAKMLFLINTAQLCVHMIPLPYHAVLLDGTLQADLMPDQYRCEIIEPDCTTRERRTTCRR